MKLCTYETDGVPRVGVIENDQVVDVPSVLPDAPKDMIGLIEHWATWMPALRDIMRGSVPRLPLSGVRLAAPVRSPRKVLAIGLNYADHIAESRFDTPTDQVWFCKQPTSVHAPYDPIEIPRVSQSVDYEAELVVVIGRRGRHIARSEAASFVFGYTVGNDVSVRDWQLRTTQWMLGKSFDTHAPIGPWITTADEVGDPHRLDIRCLVNGEVRQSSNTKHLVFDVWDQIEHLSRAMTLEPGDLIFTGTPGGVGVAMKPPNFLRPKDRVRVEIAELGAIEALMVDEAAGISGRGRDELVEASG